MAPVAALAQTGGVRGKVVDQNGEPIEGVDIVIAFLGGVTSQLKSSSKPNGDFIEIGLRHGNYRLTFRKSGYETATQEVQVGMVAPKDIGRVVMEKLPEGTLSQEEIQKANEEVWRHFDQGVAAVETEDYSTALSSFEAVVEKASDFAEAHFNMGFVYRKMNEPEKARESYEKAIQVRPEYYEAWVELGNLFNEDHQYEKSLKAFEKAIALKADEISTLYNYGAVAMNAGAMPKAQEAFGKLLAIDPNHATANYQLGMVLVNLGKNEEALSYLEKYLELDPEGDHAATARGIIDYLGKS
jgi:tetratricopeptide (TPR) repeat protein